MSRSVAEVRQYLEESQYKKLVWENVVNYLSSCVDTETHEARHHIKQSKDTPAVPQELITGIIQDIEAEKISPLREEIHVLENLQVVETRKNEPKQSERAAPKAQPKNKARVRIVAKPG